MGVVGKHSWVRVHAVAIFSMDFMAKLGKRADFTTIDAPRLYFLMITLYHKVRQPPFPQNRLLIRSHPIIQHRLHQKTMPIPRLRAPLRLIVQPIRPKMPSAAADLCTLSIPAAQQRQRLRPVATRAPVVESCPLAYTESVRDFVQGCALGLVRGVGAEAQVAVVVCFRGGDAGGVVDADGFGDGGREALVAGHGGGHGGVDAGVGGGLVGGWVRGALEGPGYGRCGGGEEGGEEEEEGDVHGCGSDDGFDRWVSLRRGGLDLR